MSYFKTRVLLIDFSKACLSRTQSTFTLTVKYLCGPLDKLMRLFSPVRVITLGNKLKERFAPRRFTLLFHQINDEGSGSFSMARRRRFVIVMFALLMRQLSAASGLAFLYGGGGVFEVASQSLDAAGDSRVGPSYFAFACCCCVFSFSAQAMLHTLSLACRVNHRPHTAHCWMSLRAL